MNSFKKKVIFCDRDGVIVVEPPIDKQLDSLSKFSFVPGAISALTKLRSLGVYEIVLVTNQDGLGTSSFPEENFWPPHNLMIQTLKGEGFEFDGIYIDRSLPEDDAPTRKPRTGMLIGYLSGDYDLSRSWVIGDRETDLELANNLGSRSVYFNSGDTILTPTFKSNNWIKVVNFILNNTRSSVVKRQTRETSIEVSLDLNGKGYADVNTGIKFFDHMLELFAFHARIDLFISATGDLPHHMIEDVGIVLGDSFFKALWEKVGIKRYGFFLLPMDEALAQVALDFSGRSYLKWNVSLKSEQIEEMPTEMFSHFFESFAQSSKVTLNICADGSNEHHVMEAVFKGFGRAVREAVAYDPYFINQIPSTKGLL